MKSIRARFVRGLVAFVTALALVVMTRDAWAAHARTTVDTAQVEAGEDFELTMTIVLDADTDQVRNCKLFLAGSFQGSGPQMGQSVMMNFVGGRIVREASITCTWSLHSDTVGTFKLNAPTASVNGAEVRGDQVTIQVVNRGTGRHRVPFDPFSQLLRDMQRDVEPDQDLQVPLESRLELATAPDTLAFLHGTLDKSSAVVGEQVTLDMYLYLDATLTREPDISDLHEPGTTDFLRENLLDAQMNTESAGYAKAGGRIFAVKRVRRYALFPLTTGNLEIAPMRLTVGRSGERKSETLSIRVAEPPIAGRPAGYAVGDVGSMKLTAAVLPRSAPRGGAIAVTVNLSGSGNLPTTLTLPTRPGVEWLTPEVRSDMKPEAGLWGGSRTFTYVVRPTKQGKLDLGAIVVPYWDASANAYAVARAELGEIDVAPGQGNAAEEVRLFDAMPKARSAFAPARTHGHLADGPLFFPLLLSPTALFGIVVFGSRLRERQKRVRSERASSPETELKDKLAALERAERGTDPRALDAATMRMIEAATLARLGLNVRGLGQERVADACVEAGATRGAAEALTELLDECAAARFAPDGAPLDAARARAKTARALESRLSRDKREKKAEPA